MQQTDIIIIGGGILGLATAYQFSREYPRLSITVLEKESQLAMHQTGHNSGVLHTGIYYKPGSLKAVNCREGKSRMEYFCRREGIEFEICGKVIVAVTENELPVLEMIYQRGRTNGVSCEMISHEQLRKLEPHVAGIKAIHVPEAGIVDFMQVCERLAERVREAEGNSIVCSEKVIGVRQTGQRVVVQTHQSEYEGQLLVNCAGLYSDKITSMTQTPDAKIIPFRGEYFKVRPEKHYLCRNLIYPVPDPEFPFLGVHFTRMTNGEIECGPNAVFTFKREGYGKTDFSLKDTIDALSYSGTWKLFLNNTKFAIDEYRRAFSKKLFLQTLQRMIPSLTMDDIKPGRAGVRAQLLGTGGETRDDFRIEYTKDSIHVLNAPSPAATACLAIGGDIKKMAEKHFNL